MRYVLALLTPTGRLSQAPFAVFAMALTIANLLIYAKATRTTGGLGPIYLGVVLLSIWMTFCIMSRRMHDTGSGGFILVPLLFAAVFAYLGSYDPELVGATRDVTDQLGQFLDPMLKGVRALAIAILVYLVRAGSETGPNAYGPEFDDIGFEDEKPRVERRKAQSADYKGPERRQPRAKGTHAPVFRTRHEGMARLAKMHIKDSADDIKFAERERPQGFGRR